MKEGIESRTAKYINQSDVILHMNRSKERNDKNGK